MDARTALLAVAAALLLVGVLGVVAVPGAIDDPRTDDRHDYPSHLNVVDLVVEPGDVGGATAELDVAVDLEHRGTPAENVTVRYRAIDADSGLLADETTVSVGDVETAGTVTSRADLERSSERTVEGTLAVDRAGDYRLETVVYADGERRTSRSTRVSGVSALTPSYADSPVGFADGDVWPTVAVSVREVDDGTAALAVSSAVTNRGDDGSGNLELRVLVRQAESNVVADDATVPVGSIRPGRTDTVAATVEVPDGYNYYVDVALWDDDVLVDETRSVANLDPQETIEANETVEDVAFAVEEFAEDAPDEGPRQTPTPAPEADDPDTGEDAPGFGALVALVALVVAALYARRST